MLEKYFNYKQHKTDFKTEVTAGFTTFLTMAYIMFLNPLILSDGGFDFGGVFTATILAAALAGDNIPLIKIILDNLFA